jgi:Na+-driven multidrug efflux pump
LLVLIPLVAILGREWGATGAATAVLASSIVFCAYWTFLFLRIKALPPLEAALS